VLATAPPYPTNDDEVDPVISDPLFPAPTPSGRLADRNALDEAKGDIHALREAVADLQRRLEKQAVLVRALFALLSTKQGLTETELIVRFREIEGARASAPAKKCPECGRGVNQWTHRCIYCGAACEIESAFEFLGLGAWPNPGPQPTGPGLRPSEEHGITTRPGG
jgi:hypothetical protein